MKDIFDYYGLSSFPSISYKEIFDELIDKEIISDYDSVGSCSIDSHVLTCIKEEKPFSIGRKEPPFENLSKLLYYVWQRHEWHLMGEDHYGELRRDFTILYRSNTHIKLIRFMHDHHFSNVDVAFILSSLFSHINSKKLGDIRHIASWFFETNSAREIDYLKVFFSESNPMVKTGWLSFNYHSDISAYIYWVNFHKIAEQGLIDPVKDKPEEPEQSKKYRQHYWRP